MFQKYIGKKLELDWKLGFRLIIVFGVLRFIAVLYGVQTGDNKYLPIVFSLMMIIPFVLLSKNGRRYIKINRPNSLVPLFYSFGMGAFMCLFVFLIGQVLYGAGVSNWFHYIGECYPIDFSDISDSDKCIYFFVFIGIGMTFSPLGEELLYRGLVHGCFLKKFGETKSSIIDSAAFGVSHLAHFGLIYSNDNWSIDFVPALLWIGLMFLTGMLFNFCKIKSNSILGAIFSHMAFNITMTYLIFYVIF